MPTSLSKGTNDGDGDRIVEEPGCDSREDSASPRYSSRDKLAVIVKHGVVHLVPVRPFDASKGMFKGSKVDNRDLRDHTDRF